MSDNVSFTHHGMTIEYVRGDRGLRQIAFSPNAARKDRVPPIAFPNFQLAVAGRSNDPFPAQTTGYSQLPLEMKMVGEERNAGDLKLTYAHEKLGLRAVVSMEFAPGAAVIRQFTTVYNDGPAPVTLTQVSSMCMQGIATDGALEWHDPAKIRVHYCVQAWQGEGQWRSGGLEQLGVYPHSIHMHTTTFALSSVGSNSTARFLPMAVIEDLETGGAWYFQIETSASWHFEIGHRGNWSDPVSGGLFMHADGANERFTGWTRTLQPGESYAAVPVAVGCCRGGFADAIRELTRYRRSVLKPPAPWKGDCPLVFNDYMNCLWGDPTRESLLPLIDAASDVGAEAFCIDAGWFGPRGRSWGHGLGDWEPSADRFGPEGLKGILDRIRAKGMIPGLWLEMEVCGESAQLGQKPDSWFLMRNGRRVGGGERWFLDYTNPDVRSYMHERIARLVAMGAGYFKNDYNSCIGLGAEGIGTSAPDGLERHIHAFYEFIDEVRARHPGLILENCGSGAMRSDYGVLSHFHLQSFSDQENSDRCPSILGGSLAAILPEQLGIWAYPWPMLGVERGIPDLFQTPEYRQRQADGEATIFAMINGLCGNLYLSGRIDAADAANLALIKEAVALYKRERQHIHSSFPIWPIGFTRLGNRQSWAAVGLANEANTRVLLAVWRIGSEEDRRELPLDRWAGRAAAVRQIYPVSGFGVECEYNTERGSIVVRLPKLCQARYFEISGR